MYIPRVIEVAMLPAFPHYQCLLETIWKQMSLIFKNLITRTEASESVDLQEPFSLLLPNLLKAAHLSLTCQNRLAMNAAGYFIDILMAFYGPDVIRKYMNPDTWSDIQQSPFVETKL
jgi:hypothetical protein